MSRKSQRLKGRVRIVFSQIESWMRQACDLGSHLADARKEIAKLRKDLEAERQKGSILKGVQISIEETQRAYGFQTFGLRTVFQPERFVMGILRSQGTDYRMRDCSLAVRLIGEQVCREVERVIMEQLQKMGMA